LLGRNWNFENLVPEVSIASRSLNLILLGRNWNSENLVPEVSSASRSLSRLAPFAKVLNSQICPKQLRVAERAEKVKFFDDRRLMLDNGTFLLVYEKGFCIENFLRDPIL
jgi:hypothetical protein